MHKLVLTTFLVATLALVASAGARAPVAANPPGNAYGAYGCCCPYSDFLGACPLTPGAFLQGYHDVCVDDDGTWCEPGGDGHYPYLGLNPNQFARQLGFGTVAEMLRFFCGHDWDKW